MNTKLHKTLVDFLRHKVKPTDVLVKLSTLGYKVCPCELMEWRDEHQGAKALIVYNNRARRHETVNI